MTYTLLNAGQIAVRPPLLATAEAIRSDIQYYEGGITWVDSAYDERLGEALRPINQKYDGTPLGLEMGQDTRAMIAVAFFLIKLNMPTRRPEMTTYEASQRVKI